MIQVQKEPKIQLLEIQNKVYRVQQLSNQQSESFFRNSNNNWITKQQGIGNKQKKKTNFQSKLYQEKDKPGDILQGEKQQIVYQTKRIELLYEEQKQPEIKQEQKIIQEIQEEENDRNKSAEITHFISLPLTDPELVKKIETYQKEFINFDGQKIYHYKYKRKLKNYKTDARKTHITILPLILDTEKKKERAIRVLNNLKQKIDEIIEETITGKFILNIRDIGTFGVGPKKARVVYARVKDGTDTIQKITNLIISEYRQAKLVKDSQLNHIKFENDIYSLEQIHITMFKTNNNEIIDCSDLLNKYRNITIGEYEIKTIDISHMIETNQQGYYLQLNSLKLK